MHNKKRPISSIDGFIPQSNSTQRRVGFISPAEAARPRPLEFPAIGQTLNSYNPQTAADSLTERTPMSKQPPAPNPAASAQRTYRPAPLSEVADSVDQQPPKPKKRRFRIRWKRVLAVFLLLLLGVGGWLGFKFAYNTSKVLHGSVLDILKSTTLRGEDTGRVNILLAGNSSDDVGHQGGDLTDSIMILSVDVKHKTGFMMSIPRDLWVSIPNYGHAKINEAYVDGEEEKFSQSGYFSGGMGLLQKVIEQNFGINLNYYALVNYNAFRDAVNAVGGIDINIQSSDPRGLYDPSIDYTTKGPLVKLTNGQHHLDGQQALDLARARGDNYRAYGFPQSDFDRTTHQRQMLVALRAKATSSGVIANPFRLSNLLDAIGKNVKTDFSGSEVRRLYDVMKDIPSSSLKSIGLNDVNGTNLLSNYSSPSGESALIPAAGIDDFSDISTFMRQQTSSDPVVVEGASIVVLNATDTSGLGTKVAASLKSKGLQIVSVGNADAAQATTSIIDLSKNDSPATKKLLTSLYGNHLTTTNPYSTRYTADYILVIGQDQAPKTTTSTGQ